MACDAPMTAYRPANGGPLLFKRPIKGDVGVDYETFKIPCGYCILCREEQARQTAVRMYHEATQWEENAFITLTYNDQHLPPNGSLNYDDLHRFLKNLRNGLRKTKSKMRYYAVGEYGDKSLRAHYHACIFGLGFISDRIIIRETPNLLWTTPTLQKAWGMGNVSVGALNFATAQYTASYVTKQLRSKKKYVRVDEESGELVPLVQPRAFMSRNLGKAWWEQNVHYVTAHDHVVIDGRPQKPPKAYDRWLGKRNELALEINKTVRWEKAQRTAQDQDKTHARARNAHARAKSKKKSI